MCLVAVSRGHADQGDTSLWSPQGVSGLQKATGVTATSPHTGDDVNPLNKTLPPSHTQAVSASAGDY